MSGTTATASSTGPASIVAPRLPDGADATVPADDVGQHCRQDPARVDLRSTCYTDPATRRLTEHRRRANRRCRAGSAPAPIQSRSLPAVTFSSLDAVKSDHPHPRGGALMAFPRVDRLHVGGVRRYSSTASRSNAASLRGEVRSPYASPAAAWANSTNSAINGARRVATHASRTSLGGMSVIGAQPMSGRW
jgi:hypothetical protein